MAGRSYLFVPGDRPDRFGKAQASGADAVILDLEDAVSSENKSQARRAVAAWLSPERPVYVRVNGIASAGLEADLEVVARPGVVGVVLPKAERPDDVAEVAAWLPEGVSLLPLIETALGVWNSRVLAEAPGVERLAFGSMDLRLDTGIEGEGEELLYALSRLVLASRVAGILPPLDGVTAVLDDPDRLVADVMRARRFGFGGKLCIHPSQVAAINQGFLPTDAEVVWARRVTSAAEGKAGAVRLEDEMVDRPVVERARMILKRAGR